MRKKGLIFSRQGVGPAVVPKGGTKTSAKKPFFILSPIILIASICGTAEARSVITLTFEEFLGHDQEPIATYYRGVTFQSGSGGSDWVARDAKSNKYNTSSWPSKQVWGDGHYWIYDYVCATTALDYTGIDGIIAFDNKDATYVELGYCSGSQLSLLAYDSAGNLTDQDSSPANRRYIEGNESGPGTLRVDWNGTNYIAYVNVHDTGNYWVVDNISTDATGIIRTPLGLTKVDDVNDGDCLGPGDEINYRIDYNYPCGPNCPDINDVNIIDYLPDEVEYVSSQPEPNEILDCNIIIWEIGTLKPGDANCIKLKVRVKCIEPGSTITITNCCEIRSGNDVNEVLDLACENTPVCEPNYNYLVVDDFEGYRNYDPNIIYKTWKDGKGYPGYPGNGTGSKVGYRDPNYAEVTYIHGGNQSMPFDYNNLKSPYDSNATRTFATDQNWVAYKTDPNHIYPLKSLSLWLRGYPVYDGNFAETPPGSGIYTMKASGEGINVPDWRFPSKWRDECHYAYIPVESTDCTITAKVNSLTQAGSSQSKAALMIRDTLNADSKYALVSINSGSVGLRFDGREVTGGVAPNYATLAEITPPCWLRLERYYDGYVYYNAYYSPDGVNWLSLGDYGMTILNMAGTDYIGLAVTASNACATCTAVFSNVTILVNGEPVALPSPWTSHQDIGIKSNTAAPLYVTLQDSNNIAATVIHNDPNIVLTTTWQPWDIDLRDFNGVDLTKVKKMTIGVSDGDPCGTGTLYFDDIRLYPPRCFSEFRPTADFTCDCVVDYRDLKMMTGEWLSTRCLRTDLYKEYPNIVNFKDFAILAENWLEEKLWP